MTSWSHQTQPNSCRLKHRTLLLIELPTFSKTSYREEVSYGRHGLPLWRGTSQTGSLMFHNFHEFLCSLVRTSAVSFLSAELLAFWQPMKLLDDVKVTDSFQAIKVLTSKAKKDRLKSLSSGILGIAAIFYNKRANASDKWSRGAASLFSLPPRSQIHAEHHSRWIKWKIKTNFLG